VRAATFFRGSHGLNPWLMGTWLRSISAAAFFAWGLAACGDDPDPLASWPAESAAIEAEVLSIINAHRDEGATCGSEVRDPTHALVMNDQLQQAARLHSYDMVERSFFSHLNPDGDDPGDRIERTGYDGSAWGENIATGSTAAQVMAAWMDSEGHCNNIMSSAFDEIGVGYVDQRWTLVFASPR
jgi:uncharacterized protein YkwD